MATLRDDLADVESRPYDAERAAHGLPHREKYLLLVVSLMHRFIELHRELIDEVDRELAAGSSP